MSRPSYPSTHNDMHAPPGGTIKTVLIYKGEKCSHRKKAINVYAHEKGDVDCNHEILCYKDI